MGALARSNPTARRGRNHLELFKIFMQTATELSTLSMGQSIQLLASHQRWTIRSTSGVEIMKIWKIRDDFDPDGQLDSIAPRRDRIQLPRRGGSHLEFFSENGDGTVHNQRFHVQCSYTHDKCHVRYCCNSKVTVVCLIPENICNRVIPGFEVETKFKDLCIRGTCESDWWGARCKCSQKFEGRFYERRVGYWH